MTILSRMASRPKTLGIGGLLLLVGLFAAGILLTRRAALAAPEQPIPFSHAIHDQAGVQCLFCHPGPLRSDAAAIPSVQKCAGCHRTIAVDRPAVQELMAYWEAQAPIPWAPVSQMADFVYFSHQPHLGAGLNCETCHGEVGSMSVLRPVNAMDMGWCLECHLDQPAQKVGRLTDCIACHK
ncbi:MAG TPA: cytochrome c3 family protein [Anaerolineales bacterium]|jgi:hypothetical protein